MLTYIHRTHIRTDDTISSPVSLKDQVSLQSENLPEISLCRPQHHHIDSVSLPTLKRGDIIRQSHVSFIGCLVNLFILILFVRQTV